MKASIRAALADPPGIKKDSKRRAWPLTYDQRKVKAWLHQNRGIQTVIGIQCECCQQFVNQVAYGRSRAAHSDIFHAVERALRDSGWPGVGKRR